MGIGGRQDECGEYIAYKVIECKWILKRVIILLLHVSVLKNFN